MNTNQTIDGVPRKALADFIEYSVPGPYEQREKWEADKAELRALLDAKPVAHQQGAIIEAVRKQGICIDDAALGYGEKPQPQGEPVAWVEIAGDGSFWPDSYTTENRSNTSGYIPLYAEPPAPVAVLSGGRRAGKSHLAAQLESLAKQVYQSWESQPGFVPWVDGGNGNKQNEARQIASRMFELAISNYVEI